MPKTLFLPLVFLLLFTAPASTGGAYAQGWRGIVPLHSTRADVERLLGPAGGECRCQYESVGEFVRVDYARARCEGYPSGWNVPADTVLTLTVDSKQVRRFSDFGLDVNKYEKAYDDALFTYYADRDAGVQYTVSSDGEMRAVSYVPSSGDRSLRCPCFPAEDESIYTTKPFDAFSGQPLENALALLDNFAIELTNGPEWKGYVVVYAGKRSSPRAVRRYARSLRRHLAVRRGVPAGRFMMMDGGYRDELTVELYLFRHDMPPPRARPTYVPCKGKGVGSRSRGGAGRG